LVGWNVWFIEEAHREYEKKEADARNAKNLVGTKRLFVVSKIAE
jgi:hypothetical protein